MTSRAIVQSSATATLAAAIARDGCAAMRGALTASELEPFRAAIARAIDADARERLARGEITELCSGAPFERRLDLLERQRGGRGRRAWNSIAFCAELHRLITHPAILDPLAEILGDGIAFNGDYHLRPKLPGGEATVFHWHRDSQYFGPLSDDLLIITAMVALVDTDEENGCLWLAPGSQRWPRVDGQPGPALDAEVTARATASGRPVEPCPQRAGDVLLFTNQVFHGSFMNRASTIRWTIDLRYSAAAELLDLAEDRDATRFRRRLEGIGYTPFRARGSDRPATTWEEWRDAHLARNPQGLQRMDRFGD
jgi:hypothetical protein